MPDISPRCPHCGSLLNVSAGSEQKTHCPSCSQPVAAKVVSGHEPTLVPARSTDETAVLPPAKSPAEAETVQAGSARGSQPDSDRSKRRIGAYQVTRILGKGGMGLVYEAVDMRLRRKVALKVMRSGEDASAEELRRFRLEAENAARLKHPNIVPIFDVGRDGELDYFTMDYVEGRTLDAWLRATERTYRQRAEMLEKVARAIHHAHQQSVIHRDIKPGNVMVDARDEPHVMDFGLARNIEAGSGMTVSGTALGTPAYMPPEQAEARHKDVGPCSDVWALGAVLYEALTGRPPFTGETIYQILRAVNHEDPAPPRQLERGVPADLETICLKCLEKNPARRYASAEAFADDLKAWREGEHISARPPTLVERAWRRIRRRPVLYATAAVVLATALGLGTWYWTRPGRLELVVNHPGFSIELNRADGWAFRITDGGSSSATLAKPTYFANLPAGNYRIRVAAPGFHTLEESLDILRLRTTQREINLRAASGFLQLAADQLDAEAAILDPDADTVLTSVAGEKLERVKLPAVVELREGPCRVRLTKPGFEHRDMTLQVPGGKATLSWKGAFADVRAALVIGCRQNRVLASFEPIGNDPARLKQALFGPFTLPTTKKNPIRLPAGKYTLLAASNESGPPLWDQRVPIEVNPLEQQSRFVELNTRKLWRHFLEQPVRSSPALADLDGDGIPDCVAGCLDNRVYAFSGRDGRKLWSFDAQQEVHSSPALADLNGDGILDCVIGSTDHNVYAISGKDGNKLWNFKTGSDVRSSPALADLDGDGTADCVVGSFDRNVYALSGRDGHKLWEFAARGAVDSISASADLNGDGVPDCVAGSRDKNMYALAGKDGQQLWAIPTKGEYGSQRPAFADLDGDSVPDCVFGRVNDGIYALSGRDGRALWHVPGPRRDCTSAVLFDLDGDGAPDCVIGVDDRVLALSGKDGRAIWTAQMRGTVLADPVPCELDSGAAGFFIADRTGLVTALAGKDGRPSGSLYEAGDEIRGLALADFDGDGAMDCIFGGDWINKGISAVSTGSGRRLWSYETRGGIWTTPALADLDGDGAPDCAIGSDDRNMYAFSGKDGKLIGSCQTSGKIWSSPALADLDGDGAPDSVFASDDGRVHAFSVKNNRELWDVEICNREMKSGPALGDMDGDGAPDCVIGAGNGIVSALSGKNGQTLWKFQTRGPIQSSPVLADLDADGRLDCVVGSRDGQLYALSGKDGRKLWSFQTKDVIWDSLAVADLNGDGVPDCCVGSEDRDRNIYAVSGKDGRRIWSFETKGGIWGTLLLRDMDGDGVADCVAGSNDKNLYALAGKDGRKLWSLELPRMIASSLALADLDGDSVPDIIIGNEDKMVVAYSGKDRRKLWWYDAGAVIRRNPALADLDGDGRPEVLFGADDGMVHVLSGAGWRLRPGPAPIWSRGYKARQEQLCKGSLPPVVCKPCEIVSQRQTIVPPQPPPKDR